jgi:hypothetical protein
MKVLSINMYSINVIVKKEEYNTTLELSFLRNNLKLGLPILAIISWVCSNLYQEDLTNRGMTMADGY